MESSIDRQRLKTDNSISGMTNFINDDVRKSWNMGQKVGFNNALNVETQQSVPAFAPLATEEAPKDETEIEVQTSPRFQKSGNIEATTMKLNL